MLRLLSIAVAAVFALAITPVGTAEDEYEGLPEGEGRDETYALCAACHSIKLVQQQGLSAKRWDALLDWMIEDQGMPELEDDERTLIVRYLAEHYGPDRGEAGTSGSAAPAAPMMPRRPMLSAPPPPPPQE